LRYDPDALLSYAAPLDQNDMHTQGPQKPDEKYFVYTGNTTYGIQNLEYDAARGCMLAAVYCGKKPQFPNYAMFAIDCTQKPAREPLRGVGEMGTVLPLAPLDEYDQASGLHGSRFPLGATGMIALSEGGYYFSKQLRDERGHGSEIVWYDSFPASVGEGSIT
jgi:hypothetical protein